MATVVDDGSIRVERLELSPYGTNTYLLTCLRTGACAVVDAPGEVHKVISGLKGAHPRYILITHNHVDHVDGLAELASLLRVPVAAHDRDAADLPVPADVLLQDGELLSLGTLEFQVLHTPGHTPGSVCFLIDRYLISGDTLFPGGPGHTSSPADFRQIVESITSKIFILPDDIRVYPGHGEATLLGREKQAFRIFSTKPHAPDLCGDVLWA